MASCGYRDFVGGICGSSSENPAIASCQKDVHGHLKEYGVRDSVLDTEASLLLGRAANCLISNHSVQYTEYMSINLEMVSGIMLKCNYFQSNIEALVLIQVDKL